MTNRIIKPLFEYTDERGTLREIASGINYHDRKKGYVAGGHYHKETEEFFYVISGIIEMELRKVGSDEIEKFLVHPNEGVSIPTHYYHSLHFLEDSRLIALLSKVFDKNNPDIFK